MHRIMLQVFNLDLQIRIVVLVLQSQVQGIVIVPGLEGQQLGVSAMVRTGVLEEPGEGKGWVGDAAKA